MMTRIFPYAAVGWCLLLTTTIGQTDLLTEAKSLFGPIPRYPPALEPNPATTEKLELGKMLYFETRISKAHNISCNTCHRSGAAEPMAAPPPWATIGSMADGMHQPCSTRYSIPLSCGMDALLT